MQREQQAAGKPQGQTNKIERAVNLLFEKVAERNFKVIPDHGAKGNRGYASNFSK